MDKLHMELMEELKRIQEKADKADNYYSWWNEKCQQVRDLEDKLKQANDSAFALAGYVDKKNKKIDELKAENARLNEQNNPHFSADMDMCEPVCDMPMKA